MDIGSKPIQELTDSENVTIQTLSEFPETFRGKKHSILKEHIWTIPVR